MRSDYHRSVRGSGDHPPDSDPAAARTPPRVHRTGPVLDRGPTRWPVSMSRANDAQLLTRRDRRSGNVQFVHNQIAFSAQVPLRLTCVRSPEIHEDTCGSAASAPLESRLVLLSQPPNLIAGTACDHCSSYNGRRGRRPNRIAGPRVTHEPGSFDRLPLPRWAATALCLGRRPLRPSLLL